MQDMYPLEMAPNGYLTESNPRQGVSAYQLQQAHIERVRREQMVQRTPSANSRQSPPLGQNTYPGLNRGQIPLPPHIAQAAAEIVEPVVTTQWDFPAAMTTTAPAGSSYPSALCSTRSSPEIAAQRLSSHGRKTPGGRPDAVIYGSTATTQGGYMEMGNPMGGAIRPMGW